MVGFSTPVPEEHKLVHDQGRGNGEETPAYSIEVRRPPHIGTTSKRGHSQFHANVEYSTGPMSLGYAFTIKRSIPSLHRSTAAVIEDPIKSEDRNHSLTYLCYTSGTTIEKQAKLWLSLC